MRGHWLKPMHGWRALIGEVGVIVLGVFIALAAQQTVEDWQWQSTTAAATAQPDAELFDSAKGAYQGLAVGPCLDRQLDGIDQSLDTARRTGRLAPTPSFRPPLHRFSEDSWLNARALRIADHLSSEQVQEYAREYFYLRDLGRAVTDLHTEAAELRPLRLGMVPMSAEEVGANQRQSGRVRELLGRVELGETLLFKALKERGIAPSNADLSGMLRGARDDFGGCAAAPDLERGFHDL